MAIPLDRLVGQKMDAYRGNPQGLQQRYQQNQQLLDLLALQKLKTEKDAAKRELALAEKPKGTMLAQLEGEHLKRTKDEMVEQTAGVMQQQQAKQQSNLQRTAQGAAPPQAAAQGAVPSPQVANAGIAAAPRPTMQMAQGGIVGFQSGKEVNVPPDKILERMGLTREKWLGLTEEMQGAYLKDFPAISAEASPLSRDITGFGDYLDRAGLEEQRRVEAQAPAAGWRSIKEYLFGTQESLAKQQAAGEAGIAKAAQIGAAPAMAPAPAAAASPGADLIPENPAAGFGPGGKFLSPVPPKPPATTPKPLATAPAAPPVDPVGKAETVTANTGGIENILAGDVLAQKAPPPITIPTASAQADVLKRAKKRAEIDSWKQAAEMGKRGLAALGRPDEERRREKERQAEAANLLAQQQDPNKLRNERLSRLLQEGARTGTLGGASAGFSAAQREQEEAARTGLASIHKTERTDEALDTVVREKAWASAQEAHKSAEKAISEGITAMAGISRDEQNRLSDETKLKIESADRRLTRILLATLKKVDLGMQADIANVVAKTGEQRRGLDLTIAKIRARSISLQSAESQLTRSYNDMSAQKTAIFEIYRKSEADLKMSVEYRAEGADKKAMLKAHEQKKWDAVAAATAGWPDRIKELETEIEKLRRGPLVGARKVPVKP